MKFNVGIYFINPR